MAARGGLARPYQRGILGREGKIGNFGNYGKFGRIGELGERAIKKAGGWRDIIWVATATG